MCYNLENDLCKNMNYFFDEQGTGYQRRSIGMIEMNKDEFLDKMKRVCKEDTICLIQCDNKKFVVSSNGLHRLNVLKMHYLNDLNNIYVFINPEHRSNGYGSYLFAEMVKIFKQKKCARFEV